jgi:hypothetical protein
MTFRIKRIHRKKQERKLYSEAIAKEKARQKERRTRRVLRHLRCGIVQAATEREFVAETILISMSKADSEMASGRNDPSRFRLPPNVSAKSDANERSRFEVPRDLQLARQEKTERAATVRR